MYGVAHSHVHVGVGDAHEPVVTDMNRQQGTWETLKCSLALVVARAFSKALLVLLP